MPQNLSDMSQKLPDMSQNVSGTPEKLSGMPQTLSRLPGSRRGRLPARSVHASAYCISMHFRGPKVRNRRAADPRPSALPVNENRLAGNNGSHG
jgi:hypothetical protein